MCVCVYFWLFSKLIQNLLRDPMDILNSNNYISELHNYKSARKLGFQTALHLMEANLLYRCSPQSTFLKSLFSNLVSRIDFLLEGILLLLKLRLILWQ